MYKDNKKPPYEKFKTTLEQANESIFNLMKQCNITDCETCIVNTCCNVPCQEITKKVFEIKYGW